MNFTEYMTPRHIETNCSFSIQLTHFLDITEVALAHHISLRSEDFFQAVSSQDQLQDDVGQTNSEIKHLR